jgi:acyloxyacyl hydrolase
VNTTYPSHSFYKFLRGWNLCNNNDFQNIGVNGGDAGNSWGNIQALSRNQKTDFPLFMFFELIGNDVCKKSFDSMTKPEKFKKDVLRLLNFVDAKVPAGSHMVLLGLGDGNVLYENLHN